MTRPTDTQLADLMRDASCAILDRATGSESPAICDQLDAAADALSQPEPDYIEGLKAAVAIGQGPQYVGQHNRRYKAAP